MKVRSESFQRALARATRAGEGPRDPVPDLGEGPLAFFFFGEGGFLFPLYTLVWLVADFDDLYFDKSLQALGVFLLKYMEGFIFHFADT